MSLTQSTVRNIIENKARIGFIFCHIFIDYLLVNYDYYNLDTPIILLFSKNKTCILFESFGILFLKSNGGD